MRPATIGLSANLDGAVGSESGMPDAKQTAVSATADRLGVIGAAGRQALSQLWDLAFDQGRLDALDELQDRFCVCMK
jgi:hypothetical protein